MTITCPGGLNHHIPERLENYHCSFHGEDYNGKTKTWTSPETPVDPVAVADNPIVAENPAAINADEAKGLEING